MGETLQYGLTLAVTVISSYYFLVAAIILMIFICEKEDYIKSTWFGFILTLVSTFFISKSLLEVEVSFLNILIFLIIYATSAVVWVLIRWRLWCSKRRSVADSNLDIIKSYIDKHPENPDVLSDLCDEIVKEMYIDYRYSDRWSNGRKIEDAAELAQKNFKASVQAKKNLARIMKWIFMWPISIISYVLRDLLDLIEEMVKKHLINKFTTISKKYDNEDFDKEFNSLYHQ